MFLKFYTKAGNLCGPRTDRILQWISSGWAGMPVELIRKSFALCGVGSEIIEYNRYLREVLENANIKNDYVTSDSDDSELEELAFISSNLLKKIDQKKNLAKKREKKKNDQGEEGEPEGYSINVLAEDEVEDEVLSSNGEDLVDNDGEDLIDSDGEDLVDSDGEDSAESDCIGSVDSDGDELEESYDTGGSGEYECSDGTDDGLLTDDAYEDEIADDKNDEKEIDGNENENEIDENNNNINENNDNKIPTEEVINKKD